MAPTQWLSLAACAGILLLAFVVLLRGARNPLALPIGLLCIDMFVWNFATLAYRASGHAAWHWLDVSFSPFTPPLALHVILAFVGGLRRWRWLLRGGYLVYGFLAFASVLYFVVPSRERHWLVAAFHGHLPSGMSIWSYTYLGAWAVLLVVELAVLVRHLKRTLDLNEQMRSRLLIAAVLVGGALGSTEFWDEAIAVPALGHLGALGSMMLVAITMLRFRLFGRELPLAVLLYAGALAALAVFGYLAVFRWLGTSTALLVVGTASITLVLLAASWDVISSLVRGLTQNRADAALGRIAAQLAHDLRNPLTPLVGGLRFLIKEREEGRSIDGQLELLAVLLEQARRINRVLKKYPLLPDVPPSRAPLQLNAVVESTLTTMASKLQAKAIVVRRELDDGLPDCPADEDLIAGALENVIANAIQAMDSGGTLTLRSALVDGKKGRSARVVLSVEDSGRGMDARQQTRAFDRHFTTREGGSGLGLDWVRRVVRAHGGTVELPSELGQGTTISLSQPLDKENGGRDERDGAAG